MDERKYVRSSALKPGMQIGQSILDSLGRVMIEKGVLLDDYQIRYLQEKKPGGVYIYRSPQERTVSIPEAVKKVIRRHRKPDRTKLQLTEEIKKRLEEDISFVFRNTGEESFTDSVLNISGELEKAVFDNDAVALDISMLKISDEYTFKHSVDVAALSLMIGRTYGLPRETLHELGIAGLLHDIGKARVPWDLLNKPGKLTEEEFDIVKKHSSLGYDILTERGGFSGDILAGVRHHHEKLKGFGYPDGLSGEEISLFPRIIAIADIFDALMTKRPYKEPYSGREAMEMLLAMYEDLDLDLLRSFIESVVLYPVDMIVELSNGELAKVVENDRRYPMRPKVVELRSGNVYDLCNDPACARLVVK